MLYEKLNSINETYPISNLSKGEAVDFLKAGRFPKWCQRQSDLATYTCIEEARSMNYRPHTQEKFRITNGWMKVTFDGKYWSCTPEFSPGYVDTEKGMICELDFQEMKEKGNVLINTANYSSEKRHAVALAKVASVYYDLSFSETTDVDIVDISELQNTKRRLEVYKFYGRMRLEDNLLPI